MIILRQKAYAGPAAPGGLQITGVVGAAPTTPKAPAPYMPNYNPNAGAKERTTAMLNNSYKAGQNSAGLKQGAMNTWNNMSKGQRIGTGVAAGAAAIGATAMIANSIKNKRKAKEADERAKAAEARARY